MKRLSLLIVFMHIAFSIMSQEIYESRFAFGSSVEKDYISNVLYSDLDNTSFHNTRKNLLDPISGKTKLITFPKQYDAFVMANFAYSIAPQSSIGFTVGMYRTWGWFVSIATDIDSDFPKYTRTDEDGTSDYYFTGREWPYKHVNKRILAEKYLSPKDNTDLKDYKFFCFNGVVKFLKVDFDRRTNHKANYYDVNWNLLNFYETDFPSDPSAVIHKPVSLIKMIELAEVLSRGIPFIRIDFYEINERPYFGEMTFFPAAGFGKFSPRNADNEIGDMLNLFV
jgi:hypothetical protein